MYIDSFTLTFPFGVKVGYVVGPYDLVDMLGRLITMTETFVSNMGAYMLSEYIERGFFAEQTRRLAAYYRKKRDLLCNELDKIKDKGITYQKPQGGILLWCKMCIRDRDVDGQLLLISQFTLYANCKKGNRPSFIDAGAPCLLYTSTRRKSECA